MAKSKKIWIADDDESIRFVLESGLSEAGFKVSTFEDGNEVVNKLDIESPHLLLTDLKMPGRDGMDLLETFRNDYQKIPIIIMTAHSDLDTTVEAFEAGAWDYIAKPFDINTAIEKINKAISEKKNVQLFLNIFLFRNSFIDFFYCRIYIKRFGNVIPVSYTHLTLPTTMLV